MKSWEGAIMELVRRKTKIICTLGPATDREGILQRLVEEGMDVARFNFSHSTHEDHKQRLEQLKAIRRECGRHVAALLDTKGPEVRLGQFREGKVMLEKGQYFTLTTQERKGDADGVSVTYEGLPGDVKVGTTILVDDGLIEMEVVEKSRTDIRCLVKNGGMVSLLPGQQRISRRSDSFWRRLETTRSTS